MMYSERFAENMCAAAVLTELPEKPAETEQQ